uniref:Uncharacterized protein n=1 Tax=Rhizophora mucronata TaxID=61149 RepID=A0A2P2IQX5_RHIMU
MATSTTPPIFIGNSDNSPLCLEVPTSQTP